MSHVAEFVRHHAGQFIAGQLLAKPGGDGDGGVLGIAPGGEGVERGVVDHVNARLGNARSDRQFLDHVVQLAVRLRGNLLRA